MQLTFRNVLKVLTVPITLLTVYFSLLLVWKFFGLPPEDEMIKVAGDFFDQYGLMIIFLAAIAEGILLVGNYFPGGVVIFIGVIAAVGDVPRAVGVVLVVCAAFFIAYAFNYFLGKYGWYKLFVKFGLQPMLDLMQQKLSRHVFTAILSSYWHPNLAAICSTAAGVMRIPLRAFLIQSTIGLVAWNIFWGVFVYITGDALLKLDLIYVLIVFLVWCAFILGKVFIFDKRFGA